jgi:hypothetical protein
MSAKLYILLFFVVTICIKLSSCNTDPNSANDYLLKVDSVHAPDSVISNKPFDVMFFGIVGLNTCQQFKTFNIAYNNNDVNIEAWGSDNRNGIPCGEGIIYLDGRKVTLSLFRHGPYRIVVNEPNELTLVKQIIVK